jgi:hypothetical protein
MKILVIICSHEMHIDHLPNIQLIKDYMEQDNRVVDYCGLSSKDDFINYESLIKFKYTMVNTKRQMTKVCDFITQYKSELDYDWYIKIRPDTKLLAPIDFSTLVENAVNARARVYKGPKRVKYGISVNGEGYWKNWGDCFYDEEEKEVILDDMEYIFDNKDIEAGGFHTIEGETPGYDEWKQAKVWSSRKINVNVIGINLLNTKHKTQSGDVNM